MREDWVEVELGNICDFIGGGTPSKKNGSYWNGNIPWASIKDIKGNILKETKDFITDEGLNNSSANVAEIGELIIGTRINPGRPIITKIQTAINQDLKIVKPKINLATSFLFYAFKELEKDILKLSSGTTVLGINLNNLRSIRFNLPPLPIQHAIVTKIENLFTSLDKGIADLKKAQEQLKVYRQAVLKKAFEGDWKVVKLNNVVNELSQGWSPKCKNTNSSNEEEWAVIKTSAIQHGAFIENENKILPDSIEPREQHEIKIGDILITRAGPRSRVGVCCLVKQTRPKLINCDKVYRLRLSDKILNDFFMYKMNSVEFLNKIEEIKTGGNDSGVNLTQNRFLNLEFELPPVDNQKQIIKEIESRLSVCDKIEQNISEALTKSDALRQSILKKAFEGKLLNEAEIEKCKQEADYEPASVLLERIKKEKK